MITWGAPIGTFWVGCPIGTFWVGCPIFVSYIFALLPFCFVSFLGVLLKIIFKVKFEQNLTVHLPTTIASNQYTQKRVKHEKVRMIFLM